MCCEEDWWQGSAGAFAFEANQRDGWCCSRLIQFSRLDAVLQLPSSPVCVQCASVFQAAVCSHTLLHQQKLHWTVMFILLSVENKYSFMREHWMSRTLQLHTRQVGTTCATFEDFWGLKGYNFSIREARLRMLSEDSLDCICFVFVSLQSLTSRLWKSSQIMMHRIIRINPN